jgi:hypothetical protein
MFLNDWISLRFVFVKDGGVVFLRGCMRGDSLKQGVEGVAVVEGDVTLRSRRVKRYRTCVLSLNHLGDPAAVRRR